MLHRFVQIHIHRRGQHIRCERKTDYRKQHRAKVIEYVENAVGNQFWIISAGETAAAAKSIECYSHPIPFRLQIFKALHEVSDENDSECHQRV